MFNFKRNLLIFVCLVVCGCVNDHCDDSYSWIGSRQPRLVSIINDSLAIVDTYKYNTKMTNKFINGGCNEMSSEAIAFHFGLFLVNYRVKQNPLLIDSLRGRDELMIIRNYFKDSSVLVFDDRNEKFGFWKIGTGSIEFNKYNNLKKCELHKIYLNTSYEGRHWINGKILLKRKDESKDSCSLLILNTENWQLESFEFSGEYEWLSSCTDMFYIDNRVACVKENPVANNFELVVDNIVVDTIDGVSGWYGNYIRGKYIDNEKGKIHKISRQNFRFDDDFVPIWVNDFSRFFKDDNKGVIEYSTEDLNWSN